MPNAELRLRTAVDRLGGLDAALEELSNRRQEAADRLDAERRRVEREQAAAPMEASAAAVEQAVEPFIKALDDLRASVASPGNDLGLGLAEPVVLAHDEAAGQARVVQHAADPAGIASAILAEVLAARVAWAFRPRECWPRGSENVLARAHLSGDALVTCNVIHDAPDAAALAKGIGDHLRQRAAAVQSDEVQPPPADTAADTERLVLILRPVSHIGRSGQPTLVMAGLRRLPQPVIAARSWARVGV